MVVVDQVGSTQIEQNQMELDLYPAMKRIREIESKPSDRVGSTQNEEVTRILEEYSEIESEPSDHRIGSTQIQQSEMVMVGCVMEEDNCNSAEKRILKEFHEIESNPSDDFKCALLDWNIYEWQFALRGPSGTEFEGGIYHGRIKFPEEYPSKPPSFMFLTENGRFKTQRDICLSRFFKWRSSRTVRYALLALIDLMPAYPDDELCSLECIKEERRVLALKSRAAATTYGSSECQKVIDQIYQYMLSKVPNGTGGSEPSQASNGTGGVSIVYNISGNTVNSTSSDRVGIFGFTNEAFIIRRDLDIKSHAAPPKYDTSERLMLPIPQLPQLSPSQPSNGTYGSYVARENTIYAFDDEDDMLLPTWLKLFWGQE